MSSLLGQLLYSALLPLPNSTLTERWQYSRSGIKGKYDLALGPGAVGRSSLQPRNRKLPSQTFRSQHTEVLFDTTPPRAWGSPLWLCLEVSPPVLTCPLLSYMYPSGPVPSNGYDLTLGALLTRIQHFPNRPDSSVSPTSSSDQVHDWVVPPPIGWHHLVPLPNRHREGLLMIC